MARSRLDPKTGEKRVVDVTGARMLALTRDALAFKDEHVEKAGAVLVNLLDCDDAKERRLAAERIRDERGLTRLVKPTEHAHLHVTLEPWVAELSSQRRLAGAKRVEQPIARVSFEMPGPDA